MLTLDRKKLVLLNPVRIDRNLAKHSTRDQNDTALNENLNELFVSHGDLELQNISIGVWDGIPFSYQRYYREQWKRNLAELYIKTRLLLHNTFSKKKIQEEEFFNLIKGSFQELTVASQEERDTVRQELEKLYNTKQQHLIRKVRAQLTIKECEAILKEAGFDKYQEEEDIVSFVVKSEAGIALIDVEYFQHEIPMDVQEKMDIADNLKVFDNFYVLYKDKNYQKPAEYTEVKKDPILFGVINGSTKLYYIGDWVTDYCDLTYDTLLKAGNQDRKL